MTGKDVSPIALLDINVLVALFDADHVHHDLAHDWFIDHHERGWATCPVTENGFIRVVSNPGYHTDSVRPAMAADQLRMFCGSKHHRFWPAQISLKNDAKFSLAAARGHGQLTDLYLLALAKEMNGTLATFDRSIPLAAVIGAKAEHLTVITPA
jgi:toxin-antitoxin system PIN domain toxin